MSDRERSRAQFLDLITRPGVRSEEHTSELQSQSNLVCRLLLEKTTDNAGPKLIQVSLALDRLLETVADVAKDMRDEGTRTIRMTSTTLIIGSFLLAVLNLFITRTPPRVEAALRPSAVHRERQETPAFSLPLERTDSIRRRE